MGDFQLWTIARKTNPEILAILRQSITERPWAAYFCKESPLAVMPGDLNTRCRLEPVPFDHCLLDRFFLVERDADGGRESLAGAAISTHLHWDGDARTLPAGWQGAVRQSYLDSITRDRAPNTVVPLLVFTPGRYKGKGIAGRLVDEMCKSGQKQGFQYAILPTLPPLQFQKEHVATAMTELARLEREDGLPADYWVRLHLRKGAEVIGYDDRSHRFALSTGDFSAHVSSDPVRTTGYHVVRLDKDVSLGINRHNMWQQVYADIERDIVTFDWGCIWVRYDLRSLLFTP